MTRKVSRQTKAEYEKWYAAKLTEIPKRWWKVEPIEFKLKKDYDDRLDSYDCIFNAVRKHRPQDIVEDATSGYVSLPAPSYCLVNKECRKQAPIMWDAVNMKVIGNNTCCCGVNYPVTVSIKLSNIIRIVLRAWLRKQTLSNSAMV
jgi:hypothetical protein